MDGCSVFTKIIDGCSVFTKIMDGCSVVQYEQHIRMDMRRLIYRVQPSLMAIKWMIKDGKNEAA